MAFSSCVSAISAGVCHQGCKFRMGPGVKGLAWQDGCCTPLTCVHIKMSPFLIGCMRLLRSTANVWFNCKLQTSKSSRSRCIIMPQVCALLKAVFF